MALGANLVTCNHQGRAGQRLMKALGDKAFKHRPTLRTKRRNFFIKKHASAPTNSEAGDVTLADGDIVLHYNTAGVYQSAYLCTAYATPTFIRLDP